MKSVLIMLLSVLAAGLVGVAVVAGYAVQVNNELVALDQSVSEKWAQVQNVYQRRADLVPNLVETVKGYARHEKDTLAAVTQARASATAIQATPELMRDPEALQRFQAAQVALSGALARLLVTLERYPTLRSKHSSKARRIRSPSSDSGSTSPSATTTSGSRYSRATSRQRSSAIKRARSSAPTSPRRTPRR